MKALLKLLLIPALLSPLILLAGCSTGGGGGTDMVFFSYGTHDRPSDIAAPGGAVSARQQHVISTNPWMEINSYTAPGAP